uniref:peroxisome biogenesis factor 13 isoform X2 n=1 Tax=Myxine glutinosa TaxID=7769 RepID=UPI00358ECD75
MAGQMPHKPWDKPAFTKDPSVLRVPESLYLPGSSPAHPVPGHSAAPRPPPVPPRPARHHYPSVSTYRPPLTSYGHPSGYGFYGSNAYDGYNPYGSNYSGGYGGVNRWNEASRPASSSLFVRQAEESSRTAFQSLESIVHAFGSVSMMLEATFSAMSNSFRAVLDVADHFSRMRVHFARVFSAFALVRTLRSLYRRLLALLMLSPTEDAWRQSEAAGTATRDVGENGVNDNSVRSWPIMLFFAVILGGPYLIWKLLRNIVHDTDKGSNWASGEDDHAVGRAEFDFLATTDEEISIRAGDLVILAPKERQPRVRGWLLASIDRHSVGLVPANHVRVLGLRRGWKRGEPQQGPSNCKPTTTTILQVKPDCVLEEVFKQQCAVGDAVTGQSINVQNSATEAAPENRQSAAPPTPLPEQLELNVPQENTDRGEDEPC